jgi:hypothetical protein
LRKFKQLHTKVGIHSTIRNPFLIFKKQRTAI